jgi:hypothetical protein
MSKKYLGGLVLLLVLGVVSSASAVTSETDANVPVKVRTAVEMPVKVRANATTTVKVRANATSTATTTKYRGQADVKGNVRLEVQNRWAEQDAKREERKVEFEAKRASSTERRVEIQHNVAVRKVEHTTRVMTATIERLENIIARIESRIAKVKANGGATAESEGHVVEAKADLSLAKTSIAAFATIDLSSDKAQENFERIRTAAAGAREQLRSAHEHMMLAVRTLTALDVNVSATSTATTTVQ